MLLLVRLIRFQCFLFSTATLKCLGSPRSWQLLHGLRGLFVTSPGGHRRLEAAQGQRTCLRLQSTDAQEPCPWLWALGATFPSLEKPFPCRHLLRNQLSTVFFRSTRQLTAQGNT